MRRRSRRGPGLGFRVLAADVEIALVAPVAKARDRHGLDDGEGVALDQDAVLERARLRLVGVADQVMRLRGLRGHRGPLPPGREGRAAAAHELATR